jgi:hypothetical protein
MRGQQERTNSIFSYIFTEDRIPTSHPLRQVRRVAVQALNRLNSTFCELYPEGGRPSIPQELTSCPVTRAVLGMNSRR